MIDFESSITCQARISGFTGARLRPPGRYDLMVECPEPSVGRLCLALAIVSLIGAEGSRPPGHHEQDLLVTARATCHHPGWIWIPPGLARVLHWQIARAEVVLSSLRDLGYLAPLSGTMNFSGEPCYRVAQMPPVSSARTHHVIYSGSRRTWLEDPPSRSSEGRMGSPSQGSHRSANTGA